MSSSTPSQATSNTVTARTDHFGRIAAVYLLSLLIGGIYVGIAAPLRMAIQADLGINSTAGIWIITIYTLFYAASIPIAGRLADQFGPKRIYLVCLGLFAAGALICGLSVHIGGFAAIITGRIIQAIGAGGIIPIATAELGYLAPENKRGMWLGMASATSGIANVIGATVGSLFISLFGERGWAWAFYLAVVLGVALFVAARATLPVREREQKGSVDFGGAIIFVVMIVNLLYCFSCLDFTNLSSVLNARVWGSLLLAVLLWPIFVRYERGVADPIFHLEYLQTHNIRIVLAASVCVGAIMMSMMMAPEIAEGLLGLEAGTGGFYMAIIGVFAIVGPPLCGRIIDARGPKAPLMIGLVAAVVGFLFLALVATTQPSAASIIIGFALVGLGLGFTMGTPLNYMILESTPDEQHNAAIASVSLIRQVGATLAPAIYVGLIAISPGASGYRIMLLGVVLFALLCMVIVSQYHSRRD